MRRSPKPWGEALWERVERFLEDADERLSEIDLDPEGWDDPLRALRDEAREIRREMVAENARRAAE